MAILLALTWGGTVHAWSSWRTIVPLVLGFVGVIGFLLYEATPAVKEPTMPMRLFTNRTSSTSFLLTFLHGILITATGHYRVFHFAGSALMAIACGLFTLLDASSSTGSWVGLQILFGTGAGFIFTSTLSAILAALTESEVATATATWAFLRSFGSIWGTAIPSAVFNSRVNQLLYTVPDAGARAWLKDGGAYQHAAKEFLRTVRDTPVWPDVLNVYVDALRVVWYVSIAFAGIGVPLAFFIKGLHLREEVNTEFGMEIDETHTQTHAGQNETASKA